MFKFLQNYHKITLFEFSKLIYIIKEKVIMITKVRISLAVDKKLNDILDEEFTNKSRYIEWLIYQDLMKHSKNEKLKKIIL